MTLLTRLFGSEEECTHQNTIYASGNCTYDDVHLREGEVVLTTYRPYYRHCEECGETFYETRHTADGTETPLGEPVKSTTIPHHVTSDYLRSHQRSADNCGGHQ